MSFVRRAAFAAGVAGAALMVWACSMGAAPDDKTFGPDATPGADGAVVPVDRETGAPMPRLIVVNGITEAKGELDGVLVCFGNKGSPAPKTIMPLTNTAGIPVGGGADLGAGHIGSFTLEVFDAATVGASNDCGSLVNTESHASIMVDAPPTGTTVIALVTDTTKPKHLGSRKVHYDTEAPSTLDVVQAHFANLSAVAGNVTLSVAGKPTADLAADTEVSAPFGIAYDPMALLVATHSGGSVSQSLESVQYASDPTSTPKAFYGVRASFLFALVGDPATAFDASAPAKDLSGRELHLVAVPYGDGVP